MVNCVYRKSSRKLVSFPNMGKNDAVFVQVNDGNTPLLQSRNTSCGREEENGKELFSGASFFGAVFNLSTTIIGAGMMALPATMKVLGLVLGIATIGFIAILTDFSVGILLKFSEAGRSTSYGDVVGRAFGDIGRKVLQICVLINNLGLLVVYMIIIGK